MPFATYSRPHTHTLQLNFHNIDSFMGFILLVKPTPSSRKTHLTQALSPAMTRCCGTIRPKL